MPKPGQWAEEVAGKYLEELGWQKIASNFSWSYGEIDLIMKDKDYLVFIEVRSLTNSQYIHPAETINQKKVKKIKKTAEYFIHRNKAYDLPCRFDFISIQGSPDDFELEHLINVF